MEGLENAQRAMACHGDIEWRGSFVDAGPLQPARRKLTRQWVTALKASPLVRIPSNFPATIWRGKVLCPKKRERRANGCWARQKAVDVVPSTMNGMVFEARNKWFNHRVSILYTFLLLLLCMVLCDDGVACDTKQHRHSCTSACTTPNSSSGQEEKGRSTNCSQCTHLMVTFQRLSFTITRIG